MTTALAAVPGNEVALAGDSPIARLVAQKQEIQHAMRAVMKEGEHYGIIPGTPKPSLWQPGADTLCFLFRFTPEYVVVDKSERDDLISYDVRCILRSIETERKIGEGMGACNSREKRYSSQASAKLCPKCSKPAIIKGKKEYGGGWVCFTKKDGCGAKFLDGDKTIEDQEGQATTAGVWDLKNTILKMACKRAKVAAVLTATAASDCFTQDLEDLAEAGAIYTPPKAQTSTTNGAESKASSTSGNGPGEPPPPKWTAGTENAPKREPIRGFAEDPVEEDNVSARYAEEVDIYDLDTGEVVRKEAKLTGGQNSKIHALLRDVRNQYDDARYRKDLMKVFGKQHTDQLSVREAGRVIDTLEKRRAKVAPELAAQEVEHEIARQREREKHEQAVKAAAATAPRERQPGEN